MPRRDDDLPEWTRTERATLRPWRADEADRLFDIMRRPEVTAWLGDPTPWADLERAHRRIEWASDKVEPPTTWLAIVPDATGVPVGTIMADHLPGGEEIEIGWFLHPDATGRGWASEAATAVHRRAVDSGARRVWAGMWPHNDASAAVCRRIGMTELGVVVDPWYGTAQFPLGRMFCTWAPDITDDHPDHPTQVLHRLTAHLTLPDSDTTPPVGPAGQRYPG